MTLRIDRLRGKEPPQGLRQRDKAGREKFTVFDPQLMGCDPMRARHTVIEQPPPVDPEEFSHALPSQEKDEIVNNDDEAVEMAEASAWPDDLPPDMLTELKKGQYHVGTMLESFAVKWSLEKCARDVWQNFFDANGYKLDGIHPTVSEHDGIYSITIEGKGIYDPRKLLHIGGTSKQFDPRAAGGFGEGTAVSSFLFLRDFKVDAISFESIGWKLAFDLKLVAAGVTTEPERGLFAQLQHQDERQEGNNIVIVTRDKTVVDAIVQARDLFYYEGHVDFKDPLFENDFGGLKLLKKLPEQYRAPQGHLYDAGQRRHYEDIKTWNNLDWMHFWTKRKTLPADRDRGKATSSEVHEHMIGPFVESLDVQQAEQLIYGLEPLWDQGVSYQPAIHLLAKLCGKLKAANHKLIFPENCAARNMSNSRISNIMEGSGDRLCHGVLAEVGMKKQSDRWQELQSHFRIEANLEQLRRMGLLQQAARLLNRFAKEIWLFDSAAMNNVLRGQYGGEQYVWLTDREIDRQPFHEAMSVYLHELDHEHGNDGSAEFTSALTKTLGQVLLSQIEQPDAWHVLANQWESSNEPTDL